MKFRFQFHPIHPNCEIHQPKEIFSFQMKLFAKSQNYRAWFLMQQWHQQQYKWFLFQYLKVADLSCFFQKLAAHF